MTDRELLQELFNIMVKRSYIQGDEVSIMDMVQRYKQPPLTRYHQVCMQMTQADYRNLENLLERIVAHFAPVAEPIEETLNAAALLDMVENSVMQTHEMFKPKRIANGTPPNVSKLD